MQMIGYVFLAVLLILSTSPKSPIFAQSENCSGGNIIPRAEGLVSAPSLTGIFNTTTGACITNEARAAFVSYKVPTFSELKSIYYDQAKSNTTLQKETPMSSIPSGGIQIG